ncbi:hypothetical protein [Shewanella halifaxensis]|nr:hypothetical protein [Shewanella halifaxensis]
MDFIRHVPALFSMFVGIAIVEFAVVTFGLVVNRVQGISSRS